MEPAARSLKLDGPASEEQQSPRIGAPSQRIVHSAFAKSPALRRYLNAKEVYERIALGLPIVDAHNDRIHNLRHLQSQLGEPTNGQRLAGQAALERISVRCGPPISPFNSTNEVLVSDGPQRASPSILLSSTTATSVIETTRSTETAPTSLGSQAPSLTNPRSDLAVPKPSGRWPCDAGCYAVFETQDDLNHHKNNMHSARLWICPLCQQEFTALPPFRDHVEICDHREAKPHQNKDAPFHTPKPCAYCERDAAQCHAQWGLDGHSAESMPAGAWDLSDFDRELSAVVISEISTHLAVTHNQNALDSPIPEPSKAGTEPTQRVASVSLLELFSLWPDNGSEAEKDFDLDHDVFLDAWEYDIVSTLFNQIYAWLNKNGGKIGRACAEGELQSGANGSASLRPSNPNASQPPSRKRAHRERNTVPPSESSGNSEERRERKTPKFVDMPNEKKRGLACPYWQVSAGWRKKECTNNNQGWMFASELRTHLRRVHHVSIDLISQKALREWVGKEKMGREETWNALFRRLFPSRRYVPSPYHTPVEVVPGQNSIQLALEDLPLEDQKSVLMQHLMPRALPVIEHFLDREPEEIRPQWKSKMKEFVVNLFLEMSEAANIESLLTVSKFIRQQDTISQASATSNARAPSHGAIQPSEYGQTLYNTSVPWKDWADQEPWNAMEGALATEQQQAEESGVSVSCYSQSNLGIIDQGFTPSNSALRRDPILDDITHLFHAGEGIQSDEPSFELAPLGTDPGQFLSGLDRNDSGYASRPSSLEASFQCPPSNCPSGYDDCFSCTHLG